MHHDLQKSPSVREYVLERVRYFSASSGDIEASTMSQLFPDFMDCIDLLEDLERSFEIDLRPFFEDGQPQVGWGPWKQVVARDVTAGELAQHIDELVRGGDGAAS